MDCPLRLSYHSPRPVTGLLLALTSDGLARYDDGVYSDELQPPRSAPDPITAFGLLLQLGSLHLTAEICTS